MIKPKFSMTLSAALLLAAPIAILAVPAAPALAREDCAPRSGASYCYCIYNNAVEDLREQTGSSSVSISQRIDIAKRALKQCLNRSTDEYKEGVDSV